MSTYTEPARELGYDQSDATLEKNTTPKAEPTVESVEKAAEEDSAGERI